METSGFPMTHHDVHRLRSLSLALQDILAVGERFELSKGVNPCWFSRPVHSTALPPHRQNVRRRLFARKSRSSFTADRPMTTGFLPEIVASPEALIT